MRPEATARILVPVQNAVYRSPKGWLAHRISAFSASIACALLPQMVAAIRERGRERGLDTAFALA